MSTISANYQIGQQFGSGTIVNPDSVTTEQLKDNKVISVLVPNPLETQDSLDIKTPAKKQKEFKLYDLERRKEEIKNPKLLAYDLAGSFVLGSMAGGLAGGTLSTIPGVGSKVALATGIVVGLGMASYAMVVGSRFGRPGL